MEGRMREKEKERKVESERGREQEKEGIHFTFIHCEKSIYPHAPYTFFLLLNGGLTWPDTSTKSRTLNRRENSHLFSRTLTNRLSVD